MEDSKKVTTLDISVGADIKQSPCNNSENIIADMPATGNLQATENGTENKLLPVVSMDELFDTAYPPKVPVVEGLINAGTYLFVGAPKVGKSFFMAQLAYHVSMGIPLWDYQVRQGSVLYLALEDDYARLQKRLYTMFGIECSENLYFSTKSKSLNEGLEEQLNEFVTDHKDARLIIIDTLQKVREASGEKFSYANDYEIVTKLKAFSDKHGICLLVVHHTRKMESTDSFDMISGTNGLLGAADGAYVMQKEKRTENKAVLEVTGRDQPDVRLQLQFETDRCKWKLVKLETELWREPVDPILELVAGVVSDENPDWEGTATELLELLPGIDLNPNMLTRKLNPLAGKLYLDYGVVYDSGKKHKGRRVTLKKVIDNS